MKMILTVMIIGENYINNDNDNYTDDDNYMNYDSDNDDDDKY